MQDELSIEKARVAILVEERNELLRKVFELEEQVRRLTPRAADDCPQGGSHVYKWDGTLPTEEMVECEKCGHRR